MLYKMDLSTKHNMLNSLNGLIVRIDVNLCNYFCINVEFKCRSKRGLINSKVMS